MRQCDGERGQAAVFITLSLTVVLGLAGLAAELGWAYYRKEVCKAAAQSAAMAGVKIAKDAANYVCNLGVPCQESTACPATLSNPAQPVQAACLYARQNGFTNDPVNHTQSVRVAANNSTPPVPGFTATYWMSVTVSEQLGRTFSSLFGGRFFNVSARSTAAYVMPSAGGCIYTLSPTDTAVTNTGNPLIQTGCGMYVNSNSPSAISLNGGARIVGTHNADVKIVGGWTQTGGSTITPAPTLGVPTVVDPFAAMAPPAVGACTSNAVTLGNHQTATIDPGVICGGISVSSQAALTLRPGVYVVKGGFSASSQATITGSGVTIYMLDGALSLAGSGTLTLTAPTSGDWQGILLFQARSNTNAATLSGNTSANLEGVVYMPNATLSLTGGGASAGIAATIVTSKLVLTGNTYIAHSVTTKYTSGTAGAYIVE